MFFGTHVNPLHPLVYLKILSGTSYVPGCGHMRMEGRLDAAYLQAYSIGWLGTAGHTVAHTAAFLEWVILQHFFPYSEG